MPSSADAALLSSRQITSPVRWVDIMEAIQKTEPSYVVEVGPGSVLSGLWGTCTHTVPCQRAGTIQQIEELAESSLAKSVLRS